MKRKTLNELRRRLTQLAESSLWAKIFLPRRATEAADVPCLADAIAGLRRELGEIEAALHLEYPRQPGEDILWRSFEFECPPDERPVLVSIRARPDAIAACWIDAQWHYLNGVELHAEVYAWSPLPAACFAQRERLMLLAPAGERRAS